MASKADTLRIYTIDGERIPNFTGKELIDVYKRQALHQVKDFARCLALQYFQLEVLAGYDAFAAQDLLHGFACQLRICLLYTSQVLHSPHSSTTNYNYR